MFSNSPRPLLGKDKFSTCAKIDLLRRKNKEPLLKQAARTRQQFCKECHMASKTRNQVKAAKSKSYTEDRSTLLLCKTLRDVIKRKLHFDQRSTLSLTRKGQHIRCLAFQLGISKLNLVLMYLLTLDSFTPEQKMFFLSFLLL